ncbi:hypothetical protein [Oceanobacillus kimchii]|uniref:Uncharacterized protein n=1 Tax=Oceanobacillus kimchii TaxID=746691 RepID=A0ABQ5TKD4_9BACI|nr:hypothetical protein [Oceanobacillus kimchii]GLO66206.1 hypothetical protein MACH08_19900 [Oceanobacillus kimchii]
MKTFLRDMRALEDDLLKSVKESMTIYIPLMLFITFMQTRDDWYTLLPYNFFVIAVTSFGAAPIIAFFTFYLFRDRKILRQWDKEFETEERLECLRDRFVSRSYR